MHSLLTLDMIFNKLSVSPCTMLRAQTSMSCKCSVGFSVQGIHIKIIIVQASTVM